MAKINAGGKGNPGAAQAGPIPSPTSDAEAVD